MAAARCSAAFRAALTTLRDFDPHCVDQQCRRRPRRLTLRTIDTLTRSTSGPERIFQALHPIPDLDRKSDAFDI
jgi:hypothetical protein